MAFHYQLDYGVKVKIISGKNKSKEGFVVMGSRFGDIGIKFADKPDLGYDTREQPNNLEILTLEDPTGFREKQNIGNLSMFYCWKMSFHAEHPEEVVKNPQYFSAHDVKMAKFYLENKK